MNPVEWTVVEVGFDDRPVFGPSCPGPQIHRWTLSVEDGNVGFGSGCPDCDLWFDTVSVTTELIGTLTFEHEHLNAPCPNAIRFLPCDCNHWWRFQPVTEDDS